MAETESNQSPAVRRVKKPPFLLPGPRSWSRGRSKIEVLLSAADKVEYDQLIANPKITAALARQWLAAHGLKVGKCAVLRHRKQFRFETGNLMRAARAASAFLRAGDTSESENINAATLMLVEQMVMERTMGMLTHQRDAEKSAAGEMIDAMPDPKQLSELVKLVADSIQARQKLLGIKSLLDSRDGKTKGATNQEIAERMREILGV